MNIHDASASAPFSLLEISQAIFEYKFMVPAKYANHTASLEGR